MSFLRRFFSGASKQPNITMESAKLNALNRIQQNPVMVFSKSYCPYCKSTKALLDKIGVKYEAYEIDREESKC